jgi:hypothetical protein
MVFLDINLTKYYSLLLHAVQSVSTVKFFKKTRLYSGFMQKKYVHRNLRNKKNRGEDSSLCSDTLTKNVI